MIPILVNCTNEVYGLRNLAPKCNFSGKNFGGENEGQETNVFI